MASLVKLKAGVSASVIGQVIRSSRMEVDEFSNIVNTVLVHHPAVVSCGVVSHLIPIVLRVFISNFARHLVELLRSIRVSGDFLNTDLL